MFSPKREVEGLRGLAPNRSRSTAIHPYFGKVDPALARALILQLSQPADIVFDPFCGSGTVILEALRTGRISRSWDSSPLAVLIAAARVSGVSAKDEEQL